MNRLDKEKLLFTIFKDQPITKRKWYEIQQSYPDINFKELKLEIINYQVCKYGEELRWKYYMGFDTKEDMERKAQISAKRKRARFVKKEIL